MSVVTCDCPTACVPQDLDGDAYYLHEHYNFGAINARIDFDEAVPEYIDDVDTQPCRLTLKLAGTTCPTCASIRTEPFALEQRNNKPHRHCIDCGTVWEEQP